MASTYREVYARWEKDPEGFWAEAAKAIDWFTPPTRVFDAEAGVYGRWFPDAVCNMCHNAVDRHVAGGRADQIAMVHDSAPMPRC
jgi:propionyl-CoA synthetase